MRSQRVEAPWRDSGNEPVLCVGTRRQYGSVTRDKCIRISQDWSSIKQRILQLIPPCLNTLAGSHKRSFFPTLPSIVVRYNSTSRTTDISMMYGGSILLIAACALPLLAAPIPGHEVCRSLASYVPPSILTCESGHIPYPSRRTSQRLLLEQCARQHHQKSSSRRYIADRSSNRGRYGSRTGEEGSYWQGHQRWQERRIRIREEGSHREGNKSRKERSYWWWHQ